MNLQGMAAVFNDVGIHKTRHNALSLQRFRNALGEFPRGIYSC